MLSSFKITQERAAKFLIFSIAALAILSISALSARAQEMEIPDHPFVAPTDSGDYYLLNRLPDTLRRSMPFARDFYEFTEHAGTSGTINKADYFSTFEEARQDMMNS